MLMTFLSLNEPVIMQVIKLLDIVELHIFLLEPVSLANSFKTFLWGGFQVNVAI